MKSIKENIITNQVLKNEIFLGKLPIVLQEKTTVNAGHVEKYDIMLMNTKIEKIINLLKPWKA